MVSFTLEYLRILGWINILKIYNLYSPIKHTYLYVLITLTKLDSLLFILLLMGVGFGHDFCIINYSHSILFVFLKLQLLLGFQDFHGLIESCFSLSAKCCVFVSFVRVQLKEIFKMILKLWDDFCIQQWQVSS